MNLKTIATSWGSFLVHDASCPTVEFDWKHHGSTEYNQDVDSREQAEKELKEAVGSNQNLATFSKRMIWHHCTPHYPKRY